MAKIFLYTFVQYIKIYRYIMEVHSTSVVIVYCLMAFALDLFLHLASPNNANIVPHVAITI